MLGWLPSFCSPYFFAYIRLNQSHGINEKIINPTIGIVP